MEILLEAVKDELGLGKLGEDLILKVLKDPKHEFTAAYNKIAEVSSPATPTNHSDVIELVALIDPEVDAYIESIELAEDPHKYYGVRKSDFI